MEAVKQELRDFKRDLNEIVAPLNAAYAEIKDNKDVDVNDLLLQHNKAINYLKNFSHQLLDNMISIMSKNEQLLDVLAGQRKTNDINVS